MTFREYLEMLWEHISKDVVPAYYLVVPCVVFIAVVAQYSAKLNHSYALAKNDWKCTQYTAVTEQRAGKPFTHGECVRYTRTSWGAQ